MEEMSFKGFSIFSHGGHLVQRSGTIWAILVEGHLTIIPGKFYQNRPPEPMPQSLPHNVKLTARPAENMP